MGFVLATLNCYQVLVEMTLTAGLDEDHLQHEEKLDQPIRMNCHLGSCFS